MFSIPSRPRAIALAAVAGLGLLSPVFLSCATAQTVDGKPVLAPNPESVLPTPAPGTAQTAADGRHLAPRGTFYIVSYVSAKTDKGVTGFVPGQEVNFVRVNREERKLVVSDGKTEVEVSPGQLTNDMDVAAYARQKDENNQAKIAAHLQAEEAAYKKYEREQAERSAQDVKEGEQRRVAAQIAVAQTAQANAATSTSETVADSAAVPANNGYYGSGGYGYGNPYSYLAGETTTVGTGRPAARNNGNNASAQGAASANGTGAGSRANGMTPPSATGTAGSATANAPAAPANANSSTGTATSATSGGGGKGAVPSGGASGGGRAGGGGGGGGKP